MRGVCSVPPTRGLCSVPVKASHIDDVRAKKAFVAAFQQPSCKAFKAVLRDNEIASSLLRQGREIEAARHAKSALQKVRAIDDFGPHVASTALHLFVDATIAQGNFSEVEPYARQAFESDRLTLGPNHPTTLEGMYKLAQSYAFRDRYADAERLLTETASRCECIMGSAHPSTVRAGQLLGRVLASRGKYEDAAGIMTRNLERVRVLHGYGHGETLDAIYFLALVQMELGRPSAVELLLAEYLQAVGHAAHESSPQYHDERAAEVSHKLRQLRNGC